jgi:Peptidase family M28
MQLRAQNAIRVAGALVVVGWTATVLGIDVPIPAKVTVVKGAKLAKFVSKSDIGFTLPASGSPEDPTTAGAELTFFDTAANGAGSAMFALDASGWSGLGKPPGTRGYKYKGKNDVTAGGACASVQIKNRVIKAVCKGTEVTLQPPFLASEGIILALPAGTTASLRYCAELLGMEKKNDATAMKRKDAPAPLACPEPPQPPVVAPDPNDLAELTDDALQGRNNNTPGSITAQNILIRELEEMGATGLNTSQTGDDAFKQPFVRNGSIGVNVLGVITGSELPDEYVMVGAHYDHLGTCRSVQAGDTVCNGATDNAAGVVTALAIGRGIAALPTAPRRSVILAFWDAEEDGLRGSAHYVENPLVPLASTVTYINYDIQGSNLLPSIKNFTFGVGSETGAGLAALVTQAASGITLELRLLSTVFGQFRSDYINFVVAGVPTVFFSDSTGPCYHTNGDEVAVVDFSKLDQQTRLGYDLTTAVADVASPPTFAGQTPTLASYEDAVIISDVLTAGLADLSLFAPADQIELQQIQAAIAAIVADGPASFDSNDVSTLLNNTVGVIDLLTRTACDGFL